MLVRTVFGCSVCICIGFTAFLVSLYNKIVEIFYRKLKRILFSVRKDNIDFSVCFPKMADLA